MRNGTIIISCRNIHWDARRIHFLEFAGKFTLYLSRIIIPFLRDPPPPPPAVETAEERRRRLREDRARRDRNAKFAAGHYYYQQVDY